MAAPKPLSDLDQIARASAFAAQERSIARRLNLARSIAAAALQAPSETERHRLQAMQKGTLASDAMSDDKLIDILSDAVAQGSISMKSLRPLLHGLRQDLLQCPDPSGQHTARLRRRIEALMADVYVKAGLRRPGHRDRLAAASESPLSAEQVLRERIDALRVRIHNLELEKTAEAAVELGAAIAALSALQEKHAVPLALADGPNSQSKAGVRSYADAVRFKERVATEHEMQAKRQKRLLVASPPKWEHPSMRFSLDVSPWTRSSPVVTENRMPWPVQRQGGRLAPPTYNGSPFLKYSKPGEQYWTGHGAKHERPFPNYWRVPRSPAPDPQPDNSYAQQALPTSNIWRVPSLLAPNSRPDIARDSDPARQFAQLDLGRADEKPGAKKSSSVPWTKYNKRHGRWLQARQAAKEAHIREDAWRVVTAEDDEREKRDGSKIEDQVVLPPRDRWSEDVGAWLEDLEAVEEEGEGESDARSENLTIPWEQQEEWVVIRGTRVRRAELLVDGGKPTRRSPAHKEDS